MKETNSNLKQAVTGAGRGGKHKIKMAKIAPPTLAAVIKRNLKARAIWVTRYVTPEPKPLVVTVKRISPTYSIVTRVDGGENPFTAANPQLRKIKLRNRRNDRNNI